MESNELPPAEKNAYYERGLELIANGRVATVVLAGGQATRAGLTYPKGFLGMLNYRQCFVARFARPAKNELLYKAHFVALCATKAYLF